MRSHPLPLWVLTGALILGLPVLSFIYWPLVLQSGVSPPHSDSIAIPMFNDVLAAVFLSPIVLGVGYLCLREYNPETRLAAWRRDRPVRSTVATVLLGGPGAALAAIVILDLRRDWPWHEHLWTGYGLLWIWWFMALRAAAIDRLDSTGA